MQLNNDFKSNPARVFLGFFYGRPQKNAEESCVLGDMRAQFDVYVRHEVIDRSKKDERDPQDAFVFKSRRVFAC